MSVSLHRIEVVLKLPTSVPPLLVRARAIVKAMTGNPAFPSPLPSLAEVGAAIDALAEAETVRQSATRGTATLRNEKRRALVGLLDRLGAYVEGVAEDDPETAGTIVEGAGMFIKRRTDPVKPALDVEPGPVRGSATLRAKAAGKKASYQWQWQVDGATSWNTEPKTLQAKTVIRGLAPGTTVWFRLRVILRTGVGDWSQAVSMIVR